jgi:hypothetical protein
MAFKLINWENTPYICVYSVPKDIFLKCNKLFIHQIPNERDHSKGLSIIINSYDSDINMR